jgi:hypothetical protein
MGIRSTCLCTEGLIIVCSHCHLLAKRSDMRFEVFTVTKIQVVVFWVLMQCSGVVGYHYFRGTCCFHLCHPEDGGSKILQNTDILPHHYIATPPIRPQLRNDML